MDSTDPLIEFDGDGNCNHCTEFLAIRLPERSGIGEGGRRFAEMIADIRRSGKGKQYDCIIGVSGGADSTYAAYLLKQAGLRILAVHMDNGWDSEQSVTNIRNLVNTLDLDYQSYVLPWEEFRDLQVAFLEASVPEAETPTDIAIPAALHHFASKYGVKFIVSAGSLTTEGILPRSWHYDARDIKYLSHINTTFGKRKLKDFPTFGYKKEIFYKLAKGVRIVYPMNLVEIPNGGVMRLLSEELGFKPCGEKHHESRYTRFIQSYYLYEKFGIDYRRAKFASQICSGMITRNAALAALEKPPYDAATIAADKEYVAKKLNVSQDELERLINLPAKWFWEYPNNEKMLSFLYDTYRRLFGREKLASF